MYKDVAQLLSCEDVKNKILARPPRLGLPTWKGRGCLSSHLGVYISDFGLTLGCSGVKR